MSRTLDKDGLVRGSTGTIYTFTGGTITPLDPDPADIRIEDIAHALAMQCRFTGHTKKRSSVAEHCVRVSLCVSLVDDELALEALLHDASEAYLADMARPLKRAPVFGPTYLRYEKKLEEAIAVHFGLPAREEMHPYIKMADQYTLECEVAYLCSDALARDMGVTRGADANGQRWLFEARPQSWSPERAEAEFLARYVETGGEEL